ncbi:Fe-S cluster assembly protein SufD [Planctomycetota bacterium]|nr:Fe-S cluster assembly protein SufD [Planctomycetota bacterium]
MSAPQPNSTAQLDSTAQPHVAAFESATLPGGKVDWLRDLRSAALGRFAELGFPTARHEEWRATNVKALAQLPVQLASAVETTVDASALQPAFDAVGDAYRLVFVDGRFNADLSDTAGLPEGVTATGLSLALDSHAEQLKPHLEGQCYADRAFVALNTAYLADGAYVHLSENAKLDKPVHLLFVRTQQDTALLAHVRNVFAADAGSDGQVIEHYVGLGGAAVTNAVTQVTLADNAKLAYTKLQEESLETFHVATLFATQATGSTFDAHSVAIGGRMARFEVLDSLNGIGAHCTLNGLYLGRESQLVDHHTTIDHVSPETTSREVMKGILGDKSTGVFRGRVIVKQDAQRIEADQLNRSLLLSDDARINTRPQLEIYADDVKCTHAATVGSLDEAALFYLRTRGVGFEQARAFLTQGFASEITQAIPFETLRNYVEGVLPAWLAERAASSEPKGDA